MSVEDDVSLLDIKRCVLCASCVSDEGGTATCRNASCYFTLTAEACESQLSAYAKDGSMKFCYACGCEVKSDENFLFCDSCSDSIKFDVFSKEEFLISASDVKYCVLCASAMETNLMRRCTAREENADSPLWMFCYACGSNTYDDGKYNVCTNDHCSSAKLPGSCVNKGVTCGSKSPTPNSNKLTPSAKAEVISEASDVKSIGDPSSTGNGNTAVKQDTNQIQVTTTRISSAAHQTKKAIHVWESSAGKAVSSGPSKGKVAEYGETGRLNHRREPEVLNALEELNVGGRTVEDKSVFSYLKLNPWKSAVKAIKNVLKTKEARPAYQMVFIGETGSGKTSLFNLFCNFNLICELGLEEGWDKLHNFHDLDLERAQERPMESKTSNAKCYKVRFDELEVKIIDTPGFGDSRGIEEDKKNVKKIVDTINRDIEYVNCICLVINGRQARTSYQLKYVLTEISATLPKTAFNNLITVMTNCQDMTCASFDVKVLSEFFGSDVVIKPEYVFYIDNPYSKLEKCQNEKMVATHNQLVDALRIPFQIAGETLIRILETVKDFHEVHTNCFVQLYDVKQDVEKVMLEVLVAQQNQTTLENHILLQKQKLDVAMSTKTLNEEFTTTFKVRKVIVTATKMHNTICSAPNCNSNCHISCCLSKTLDKENLRSCTCMDKGNDYKCKQCGHSYLDHFHSESVFEIREEENILTDKERKRKFEEAKTQEELCVMINAEYNAKLELCKEYMENKKVVLIATVERFEALGSSPSYEKLLECQVYVLDQSINAQQRGDDLQLLKATKKDLEDKLSIVRGAKIDVQSESPAAKVKWAQCILGIGTSSTRNQIEESYKALKMALLPTKPGETSEIFQNVQEAHEIIMLTQL
eukprot:Em0010g304a